MGGADRGYTSRSRRVTTTPSSPAPAGARATSSATRVWPAYALRSAALGPGSSSRSSSRSAGSCRSTRSGNGVHTRSNRSTNGAQPDWYLGWLIGGLRLVPRLRRCASAASRSSPTRSGAGGLFPVVRVRRRRDVPVRPSGASPVDPRASHHLLGRPRDHPWRTASGSAFLTWVWLDLLRRLGRPACSSRSASPTRDRSSYTASWRPILPIRRVRRDPRLACDELRRSGVRPPLRGGPADGGAAPPRGRRHRGPHAIAVSVAGSPGRCLLA